MIFDFSYKTGVDFSGLYSPLKQENIASQFYGNLYLNSDVISGKNSTNLTLNGQMLAEQTAEQYSIGSLYVYLNSGDYFTKDQSTFTQQGFVFKDIYFNEGLSTNFLSRSNIFFSIKDHTGQIPLGSGSTPETMTANLSGSIVSQFPNRYGSYSGMSSFDYFVNGQKIYSGSDGSYDISGSTFVYNEQITGKIFAIPKNTGLVNYTGLSPDVYNQEFVEKTAFGYINGLALDKINWVELYTGVNNIQTGIQSRFFLSSIDNETILL